MIRKICKIFLKSAPKNVDYVLIKAAKKGAKYGFLPSKDMIRKIKFVFKSRNLPGATAAIEYLSDYAPPKRIYAIGDIHGQYDLFKKALSKIKGKIVLLGDLIDRGPGAFETVEAAIKRKNLIAVKGNHEEMLLSDYDNGFLSDFYSLPNTNFTYNGGTQTIESYIRNGYDSFPRKHIRFYKNMKDYYETDHFIFVHGGIPPGKQPSECDPDDLRWIRGEFIRSNYDWGKMVIFGHTPQQKPLKQNNKIGIDTGAGYGHALTVLELPTVRFYTVKP